MILAGFVGPSGFLLINFIFEFFMVEKVFEMKVSVHFVDDIENIAKSDTDRFI